MLVELTEKEWQQQLVKLARQLGWTRIYHTYNSQRSASGFPDLVLVRERVVFVELKREAGKLTDAQIDWLRALLAAGGEAYIVRPRHLEAIAAVLQTRVEKTLMEIGMHPLSNTNLLSLEPVKALHQELDRELGKKAA